MIEKQKLKIIVFEDDQAIANVFTKLLRSFGHTALVHSSPSSCPIFTSPSNECPKVSPCADALISDVKMPHMNGIDFLKLQKVRSCKILNEHKALMSSAVTLEQSAEIRTLGFKFFNKPFNAREVINWLDECGKRTIEESSEL